MAPMLSLLGLGFLLGVRHATDADHVVAVTTIVSRERRIWASSLIGSLWGLGHTATISVVGGAILLLKIVVPPGIQTGMDLAVAAMLIALGTTNVLDTFHGSNRSAPTGAESKRRTGPKRRRIDVARPIGVGVVHGLAGSAAAALLILSTVRSTSWGLLYLAIFGLGTVSGMVLLTTLIALPFAYSSQRFGRLNAWLTGATGIASIGFGTLLGYEAVAAGGSLASP